MQRSPVVFIGACLIAFAGPARAQEPVPLASQSSPVVRDIRILGIHELPEATVRDAVRVTVGQSLTDSLEHLAEAVDTRYHMAGYSFARATAIFDAQTGTLTVTVNEGVIDAVEFDGVDQNVARTFIEDFALRAGDVFNRERARQALDALLQRTRGAVRPGRIEPPANTTTGASTQVAATPFALVPRDGMQILRVALRQPPGRFKLVPDLGEREDWFTSVDGFVPSVGFGTAVFDHQRFNHSYVAGHLSLRTGESRVGYALGFERPFFGSRKLYVGGELHDLTASDDQWQVSSGEASIAALGPRLSYRDYYRRRGLQVSSAFRIDRHVEIVGAWRDERQEGLQVESDFSLWNSDDGFRPNLSIANGRLHAIVVGASVDGRGFDRESLEATYRRHQLETPFGERLEDFDAEDQRPIWRVDWLSEISTPDLLDSDFNFRRHIVSGRARVRLSSHQDFSARVIGGWSEGLLPSQRQFAIGGIGSVHGYSFKEAVGDSLALMNLEYALGWRHRVQVIGLFDAGRVTPPTSAASPWLKGVGVGLGLGDIRLDFGYKLDAVPSSLQVLLRFGRTF